MHKFSDRVSKDELNFIRRHAPRGLWKMVQLKTGRTRSQVDYQLRQQPEKQDPEVILAARELLKVVTGLCYHSTSAADGD